MKRRESKTTGFRDMARFATAGLGVLALVLLAACQSGGNRGNGMASVDLRPIVSQIAGGSGQTAQSAGGRYSPTGVSSPTGPTVTPVETLIIGALVIDFTDTPLGPNTSIDATTRNNLKNAAVNSIKFLTLVQLPTSDDTIQFLIPPPGAKHWQVFVAGTRNTVNTFEDIKDDSVIYYGFNTDMNGNPFFLTSDTIGSAPVNVTLGRACIASNNPPLGCAAYNADKTLAITAGAEVVGLFAITNGVINSTNLLGGSVISTTGNPSGVATAMANALAGKPLATGFEVDTTHQSSQAYVDESSSCTGTATTSTYETAPGTPTVANACSVEFYTTIFN